MIHRALLSLAVFALMIAPPPASAECPSATFPWVDGAGNRICRAFDSGQIRTPDGSLIPCPSGAYPLVDSWGNRVCAAFDRNERYQDSPRGCPLGTTATVDQWGNTVCRAL
jgi:hypothetical protein